MRLPSKPFALLLSLYLFMIGCTSDPQAAAKKAQDERILARVAELEKNVAAFDDKIKAAKSDHGLQAQLRNDQELARARLARMKLQLSTPPAEHAPAGH